MTLISALESHYDSLAKARQPVTLEQWDQLALERLEVVKECAVLANQFLMTKSQEVELK